MDIPYRWTACRGDGRQSHIDPGGAWGGDKTVEGSEGANRLPVTLSRQRGWVKWRMKPVCSSCRFAGPAADGEVTFARSGTSRRYLVRMCITCWLTLCGLVEDQSLGFTESLPFVDATAKRSRRRSTNTSSRPVLKTVH
jgi:hypothetical protein